MQKINLSIPEPCHENWDKMTKTEKGKFCNACAKTVFDFTNMSDRELAEFFKKPPASACGRFQQSQLDRDILIPRKRIPWIKYFFQFSLPAFLLSSKAQAQGEVRVKDSAKCTVVAGGVKAITSEEIPPVDNKIILGKITDAEGNPIPGATILVKGTRDAVAADANGFFEIRQKPGAILIITSVGFETREIVTKSFLENIVLTIPLSNVTMGILIPVRRKSSAMPLIKHFADTAFKTFRVYPNPVSVDVPFKIDTRNLEKAMYVISILTDKSEVVQESQVTIENKNQLIDCVINQTTTGIYFIRFTNKKSGKSFTEKIMVR